MTSIHLGIQSALSPSASKGSLQKVPLVKVSSHNSGTTSPKQIERKTRGYQSSKTLILHQEKNGEDGTDSTKKGALKNGTLVLPNTSKDDLQPISRKLELSEIFAKYTLTTDVPFMGSRTTKAKIEPVKPVEITPKAAFVMKPTEDLTPSPSKYPKLTKTTSRLLPPDTKSVTGSETKSLDKSIRKNRERDSQVTVEVDTKLESPSKSSFDLEADSKEKQAFLTEALMAVTPDMMQDQDNESIDLMQNTTNEDTHLNHSIHSDERQNERKNYGVREGIKRLQIQKQTYDPFSVLNQVRTKRRQQETTNRKLEQSKFETRISQRNNIMSDSSKLSTPRDFTVLRSRKVNLFEGIPYVPYDIFLRQDPNMQNVIVKDILKVLLDKAKSLQNFFRDNYRIDKIMKNIEEPEQGALNLHLEETIGLINAIGTIILQEFKDSVDKIGIKPSPIFDNPNLRISGFVNEIERFYDNSNVFLETIEHLRDCVDCYYVMTRQRDRKPIADYDCSNLLQFIARSRYNLGQLFEAFRVIEKHVDGKLTWKAENKKKAAIDSQNGGSKPKGDNHKSLNDLLQQKFNINKNKMLTTRESKVVLNQEAEDEKFLRVVQNQKQLKKKGAHEIGDSRKLIILDRILNPLEDPEIQLAIKVAKEKTNVQISKDLLESIGSRTKSVDHKSKPKMELPFIKNTMQKMMSTKNLTNSDDLKKANQIVELPKLQKPKKITTKTR